MTRMKDRSAGAQMPRPPQDDTVPNPNARNQSASGYPARWPG